jgi:N-acetylneuraminate synthase
MAAVTHPPSFSIEHRRISHEDPPYVIAEMSANHGGDLARALAIIRMAAERGADAIKFQVYTADGLTLDSTMPGFVIEADNPWKGRRLHELYASAATPYAWFPELFAAARAAGITPFASVFGTDGVELMERLGAPAYKVASFEAVDLELIAACARTSKPLVISTGLCTEDEMAEALAAARGARAVALLKCSSAYPAIIAQTNLAAITRMRKRFGVPIGYSDHTLGIAVATAACALGACIVEKHVIDQREPPTADSDFSALPEELGALVASCRAAFDARGDGAIGPSPHELPSRVFRRSLYAVADIAAGDSFSRANVRSIRPGFGLAPRHLPELIGRRARRAIARGEPLDWNMVE